MPCLTRIRMPELPEVEVTRQSFAHRIAGAQVLHMRMGKPLRWPLGVPPQSLVGQRVGHVGRRGKYLLLELSDGVLLLHLGMSGSLHFAQDLPEAGVHDHMDLVTSQGTLRLHDPRRFGAVVWASDMDAPVVHKLLDHLGAEPLGDAFVAQDFHQALRKRRASIKPVLLAGDVVVGVGNIYASEALFAAGIRPTVHADRLSLPRVKRLHAAIRDVLSRAVAAGGSSMRDFVNAHGQAGHFQQAWAVYGRAGQPCHVCATPVRTLVQGQRSTYYCPQCQKP